MPTRLDTNFARPLDDDEFESMIRDICALEWHDPNSEKFGRKGQKQHGVDVYGQPIDAQGKYRAAQCKLRTTNRQLSADEIETEVTEARQFPHDLDTLILVTDAPRDTRTQILVDRVSQRELRSNGFRVVIWFWDDITARLSAFPRLIVKYYRDYFANLTTLPVVERLIDTPLQILSVNWPLSHVRTDLEESLTLRGIRILTSTMMDSISGSPSMIELLPDGLLYYYNVSNADSTEADMLRFASHLPGYIRQIDSSCPVFVQLPSQLTQSFLHAVESLHVPRGRIQILHNDQPLGERANDILQGVFDYGHARRGGLATMNITVRTREGKPDAVLLDVDWQTRLSTSQFPTPEEWQRTLLPALTAVRNQILNQSDQARVHINCQLPLPAAFALGFLFNIRVARIGVWARRTGTSDFKRQFWSSDGYTTNVIYEPKFMKQSEDNMRLAIVELTSYTQIHKSVECFAEMSGIRADVWVRLGLSEHGDSMIDIDESHAVAYANQVGQLLRFLNEQGVTDIHLFARVPSALAVLIGQRLHACGRVHLYWFDNPTYRFAFTLV